MAATLPSNKPSTTPVSTKKKESVFMASQWQLIRWKFLRHRIAVIAMVVLAVFYLNAAFAEFFAPYDPWKYDENYIYVPPQKIHFIDAEGRFHLRPFVYALEEALNETTLIYEYTEVTTEKYFIRFFVRGEPYKLWGLFEGNLHFFGTREGVPFFIFGTDKTGRDVLSLIIHGSRVSMTIGLVGVALSFFLGVLIGGVSGYYGGVLDLVIQRIIEFIRAVPTLPLWMGLSAALPPRWSAVQVYFGITVILSIFGWTGLARVVRGKFMSVREEDFVTAAVLDGVSDQRIVFKYLLPSFYSHIIASLTISIPYMILGETALSFIGLGLQAPAISWGVLLREAQAVTIIANSPWLLIPGLFVIVAILAFNFVGDGLRDAADPYSTV